MRISNPDNPFAFESQIDLMDLDTLADFASPGFMTAGAGMVGGVPESSLPYPQPRLPFLVEHGFGPETTGFEAEYKRAQPVGPRSAHEHPHPFSRFEPPSSTLDRLFSEPMDFVSGDPRMYGYLGYDPTKPEFVKGPLTWKKATEHWREGLGTPLVVDVGTLDLRNVLTLPPKGQAHFDGEHLSSANDALVYGTMTLYPGSDNTVIGGRDKYDFDIKPWSPRTFIRNVETMIGREFAGPGTPFEIRLTGTAPLGPKDKDLVP